MGAAVFLQDPEGQTEKQRPEQKQKKTGRQEDNMVSNPRSKNGTLRRKHRQRFKAMGAPCGICGGRLGPIHYEEPSDAKHPLSFVIDEIRPVSKWRQFGYSSPEQAAQDWENLQPAHYICNQAKSNKTNFSFTGSQKQKTINKKIILDGEW